MREQDCAVLAEDTHLRSFAASESNAGRMPVIVEVAAPPVRLAKAGAASQPGRRPLAAAQSERAAVSGRHLDDLKTTLSHWSLPIQPVMLPAAHALVVSVTPDQLRDLCKLPNIASIRRNRPVTTRLG